MRYFLLLVLTVYPVFCQQINLTKNVQGVLPVNHGGTGLGITTNNTILVGTGGGYILVTLPDCQDTGGNHLNYNGSTRVVTCGNSGGGGGGGAITQLTGDLAATGPGVVAGTLATVNSGPGLCGDSTHVCQSTVNAKGLVTLSAPVLIATGAITQLTGDLAATGPGVVAGTLATVNSGPGICGDATHVCQTTFNGKGLTTLSSAVAINIGYFAPVAVTFLTAATTGTLTHNFASATHEVQCGGGLVSPSSITLGVNSDTINFLGGLSSNTICIASR